MSIAPSKVTERWPQRASHEAFRQSPASEAQLRQRIGIPAGAERILIFGESSHWDPNWLYTSEEYYQRRIERIFEEVLRELQQEERRIFSLECLFFLRLFWERHPERRDLLARLLHTGQLRLTGTGITTPDTLLPEAESILRDYLVGQEWLLANGLQVEPRLAYLPDGFGHSPRLPVLLQSLGFTQACFSRIDGMYFVGADWRRKSSFPLPGSSAELLQIKHRTLDFRWRTPDGSELLCHWNAFTYFQGDMLAHKGIIRWMGIPFGISWRTARHVARRIKGYVRVLDPLRRTPYMFCPIGCDFNGPIPELLQLLRLYNERYYEKTGIWVANAGMDDYLDLVSCHRQHLPVLALDPNPYWMGFYASRPRLKGDCREVVRKLEQADGLSSARLATGHWRCSRRRVSIPATVRHQLQQGWELAIVSNHHDFITGTSPDRVVEQEQRPWLKEAGALADQAQEMLACHSLAAMVNGSPPAAVPPCWRQSGGLMEVETAHYRLRLSEELGGCLVSLSFAPAYQEMLAGPANDIAVYKDTGGLWRMGHEYRGGRFKQVALASAHPAVIKAAEREGLLEVTIETLVAGRPLVRWLWLDGASPVLQMGLRGAAPPRRTITVRFPTMIEGAGLTMDVPGGVVQREIEKHYRPTFWSASSFVHLVDEKNDRGLAVFFNGPGCVSYTTPGVMEWVVLRNAIKEQAFGFLPVPAHPVGGQDNELHQLEYALTLTAEGDFMANRLPFWTRQHSPAARPPPLSQSLIAVDHREVLITALKIAHRGVGLITRLQRFSSSPRAVWLRSALGPIQAAWLCDARERDLMALEVSQGQARVPLPRSLISVRIIIGQP